MTDRKRGGPFAGLMLEGPEYLSRRDGDFSDWGLGLKGAATASATRGAEMTQTEIRVRGERVTAVGYAVQAPEIHGLHALPDEVREAGVIYGAICEELSAPGAPSGLGVQIHGGRYGGGCGVDRRLTMAMLLERAHACLAVQPAMEPQRAARPAVGEMTQRGRVHVSHGARGEVDDVRRPIPARVMVDMVCVDGASFRAVLRAHGWREAAGTRARIIKHIGAVMQALADEWNGDEAWVGAR